MGPGTGAGAGSQGTLRARGRLEGPHWPLPVNSNPMSSPELRRLGGAPLSREDAGTMRVLSDDAGVDMGATMSFGSSQLQERSETNWP